MRISVKSNKLFCIYLLTYLFLLFKSGFFFIEQMNKFTAPVLLLLFILFGAAFNKRDIQSIVVIICIVLVLLILITNLFKGFPGIFEIIFLIVNIITAALLVSFFDEREYYKAFCDIMLLISIVSIVAWVIMQFNKAFFFFLPGLVNTANRVGYFAIFTIVSDFTGAGAQRVQGIFWEPGAYQCLAIVAMMLEKFYKLGKNEFYHRIIYSIAIVLSFSTTGYIALILVWLLFLRKEFSVNNFTKIILVILAFGVATFFLIKRYNDQLYYTIYYKINEVIHYKDATNYSVTARVGSVLEPIRLFLDSPIVGIGENGYEKVVEIVGLATCTPINYICKYGLLFAFFNFFGFYKVISNENTSSIDVALIIMALCIAFFSETFFMNPLLLVFMLYGWKKTNLYRRRV